MVLSLAFYAFWSQVARGFLRLVPINVTDFFIKTLYQREESKGVDMKIETKLTEGGNVARDEKNRANG